MQRILLPQQLALSLPEKHCTTEFRSGKRSCNIKPKKQLAVKKDGMHVADFITRPEVQSDEDFHRS